ncbi:MAG: transposase [Bacteroidales bacterium]|nr:transposase [Bacteroidales bacterium]
MAKLRYKSYAQNDIFLFPPSLEEMVPSNHKARVVNAVIDKLDISAIESRYKAVGNSSYHPRELVKVITYAYLDNVFSGHMMETLLNENVIYMWLSGMNRFDFRIISEFRVKCLKGVYEELFTQLVILLNEEGLVSIGVQCDKGAQTGSAASKYSFVWKQRVERDKAKLEKMIYAILAEAEDTLSNEEAEIGLLLDGK